MIQQCHLTYQRADGISYYKSRKGIQSTRRLRAESSTDICGIEVGIQHHWLNQVNRH